MRSRLGRRLRFAWQTARFYTRMLLEHVGTVWLLGIAPFLAHLAAAPPQRGYNWASLEAGAVPAGAAFRSLTYCAIAVTLGIDLASLVPVMMRCAIHEAMMKGVKSTCTTEFHTQ